MQAEIQVGSERVLGAVLPRLKAVAVHEVVKRLPEVKRLVAVVHEVDRGGDGAGKEEEGEEATVTERAAPEAEIAPRRRRDGADGRRVAGTARLGGGRRTASPKGRRHARGETNSPPERDARAPDSAPREDGP